MSGLERLTEIIAQLRGPEGCPWDREQTLLSMRPHLLEEVYEVLECLDQTPVPADALEEELGDLLFVVLLIIQIGADAESLSLAGATARICDKMITRHPHVFGTPAQRTERGGREDVWERRKAQQRTSLLDGIPRSTPALHRAAKQGQRAAAIGFDWPDVHGVLAKVEEELAELRQAIAGDDAAALAHEYGDVLLSVASLGRHLSLPPEATLRCATDRFADRFRALEALAQERGIALSRADAATLDALWEEIKAAGGDRDSRSQRR